MNIVEKYLTSYDVTFFVMKKKDRYLVIRMKNGLVINGKLTEMDKRTTLGEFDDEADAKSCLARAFAEYKAKVMAE